MDSTDLTIILPGTYSRENPTDSLPRSPRSQTSTSANNHQHDAGVSPAEEDSGTTLSWPMRALAAHNTVRDQADSQLPPLAWSTDLADLAQQWANTVIGSCEDLRVRHRPENNFGENLTAQSSFGAQSKLDVDLVVKGWASEVACWTPGTFLKGDACSEACVSELHSTSCGHYTQLVWRDTTSVGCGYAFCVSGRALNEIWVCNYAPAGNIRGQQPF